MVLTVGMRLASGDTLDRGFPRFWRLLSASARMTMESRRVGWYVVDE
jgi:hypothetical protein